MSEEHNWSSLVGKKADEAEQEIRKSNPSVKVVEKVTGDVSTTEYRNDRVRLVVNDQGEVTETPKVG
ncbi:serine protease inhibitor [Streptomyces sp. NPDC048362]|uniref:serine protease inhibitor n=1 Tax=Streptomyces sp. NPDC048362 TaxID=3365539 RepID=UPI00371F9211